MFSIFKKGLNFRQRLKLRVEKEYAQMDYGRVFGWWLRLQGKRIGDLNYRRWDSDSQFWHEYYFVPISESSIEIDLDPNRWAEEDVSVESRYAIGYTQRGLLMAPKGNGIVSIRSLSIPEDIYMTTCITIMHEQSMFPKLDAKIT